jgi:hypothetical protein
MESNGKQVERNGKHLVLRPARSVTGNSIAKPSFLVIVTSRETILFAESLCKDESYE